MGRREVAHIMRGRPCRSALAALSLVTLSALSSIASGAESERVDFERDVKPILRDHCWECHGPRETKGALRLDKRRFALSGGERDNIIPGAPEISRLYRTIAGLDDLLMPEDGMLDGEKIAVIHDWIAQGAHWPEDPPEQAWHVDPEVSVLAERIRLDQFKAVRRAILARPKLLEARDSRGATLLSHVATYGSARDLVWLLARGADPNVADGAGHTPLMLALDDAEKVRTLLDAGANPNARTEAGRSVVEIAADQRSSAPLLKLLLEHGTQVDEEQGRGSLLVQVSRNGDLEAMRLLVERQGGRYPRESLGAAAASNCIACLNAVLDQDPEPELLGRVLSSVAIMARHEVLAALLEAGADPNYRESATSRRGEERDAKTILMKVVYSDYADTDKVRLLLEHGADVNARSSKGGTALDEARKKGRQSPIVALLLEAGAKE